MSKKLLLAVVAALIVTSVAAAAWVVYTPVASGSVTGGKFAATTPTNMISFTATAGVNVPVSPCSSGAGASCVGGTPVTVAVTVKNNDPAAAHAASGLTVTLTTGGACDSHLFVTGTSGLTQTVAAGGTATDGLVTFVADPSTPTSCSSLAITATISGAAS